MKRLLSLSLAFLVAGWAWAAPTVLYVSEGDEKRVAAYTLNETTGELTRAGALNLPGSPGSLALGKDRAHLYVAIRSSKKFGILSVNRANGMLSNPFLSPAGFPTSKKAHCIQTEPSDRFAFVPHVGELNKVEQLRFDPLAGTLAPNKPPFLPGGEGQGPRRMQFHPNGRWVYLVNKQGKSVTLCDFDPKAGTLKIRQTVTTAPPDCDKTKGSCADIHVSPDGRFVYASNRGHDSLAGFSVRPDTGELTSLGQTPTEKTPRSFCLIHDFVISAKEGSHRLIVYRRNARSGALTPLKTCDCGKGLGWVLGMTLG